MRRSYTLQKMKKGTLCLLLATSTALFFDAYKEPYFKRMAERKLDEISHNTLNFKIADEGKIEGGIFKNIVIKDVLLDFKPANASVRLERIELPYRIWHPFLKGKLARFLPKPEEKTFFVFFGDRKGVSGFLRVSESVADTFVLGGSVSILNNEIPLEGRLVKVSDFLREIDLKLGEGISLKAAIDSGKKKAPFNIRLSHISVFGVDIVCDIEGSFYGWDNTLMGSAAIANLIVNYKPFKDITAVFGMDREKSALDIFKFNVGDEIKISGNVGLENPYYTDLILYIQSARLEEFNFSSSEKSSVRGLLNGEIHLKGPAAQGLITKGHVNAQNGSMGGLEFDTLFGTLAGKGKIIKIEDARIFKGDGSLILTGRIDFGRFKEGKVFEDIDFKVDKNLVVWEGWRITKNKDKSVVEAEKKVDDALNIKFRFEGRKDAVVSNKDKKNEEVELEYKLDKHESLKMKLKGNEEFVGVEHKIKF